MSLISLFSRYHPKYIRSLVYMLQATEYTSGEFFKWYKRVADFRKVEKRKKLDLTLKARLLLFIAWLILIGELWLGISSAWTFQTSLLRWGITGLVILIAPYVVAVLLPIPLLLLAIIQRPVQTVLLQKAAAILKDHKGVRIAISGGYGKTTMREILSTVLSEGKKVATPLHNHNTPLGISKFIESLSGDEDILIFELGEYYPGDVRELCQLVRPDIGIITGVSEVHLDKFKTVEKARETVFELSEWLDTKPVYVNVESELVKPLLQARHISYSREGIGEWRKTM